MHWTRTRTAVVGGILLGLSITVVPAATAHAAETTKPKLTVPPYAQFLQGAQLGPTSYLSDGSAINNSIPVTVGWNATDASGICGYTLKQVNAGGPPDVLLSRTSATSYQSTVSDYTNQEGGGGGWPVGYSLTAFDCAGNQTTKAISTTPSLTQDDNSGDWQPGPVDIVYSGAWQESLCACYDAGSVQKTTAKGATATITFSAAAQDSIALVMEKGTNRGRFTVFVDGVNRGTIDNYSRTTLHKVIAWSGRVTTSGDHVVRVVNQATSGRPRIDLDAVLRMY
jgi:hypothetical protein